VAALLLREGEGGTGRLVQERRKDRSGEREGKCKGFGQVCVGL